MVFYENDRQHAVTLYQFWQEMLFRGIVRRVSLTGDRIGGYEVKVR